MALDASLNTSIGGFEPVTPSLNKHYIINTVEKLNSSFPHSITESLYPNNRCLTFSEIQDLKTLNVTTKTIALSGSLQQTLNVYNLNELVQMIDISAISQGGTIGGGDDNKTTYNVCVELKRVNNNIEESFDYVRFDFSAPTSVTFYAYSNAYTIATAKNSVPLSYADFKDCSIDKTINCPIVTTLKLTDTEYNTEIKKYDTYGDSLEKYCYGDGHNFSNTLVEKNTFAINWYLIKA